MPGNREYLSEPITSMVWPAGKQEVLFFLRKGGSGIRRWPYKMPTGPARDEKLEIRLRQTPAQGSATLSVTAPGWEALRRTPIRLEWEELPPDPRSEAEILAALARPRPAVPQRVIYQADIGLWDGSLRQPGLRQALREFRPGNLAGVSRLLPSILNAYRRSEAHPDGAFGPVYPVSTDGVLPAELDLTTRQRFREVVDAITEEFLDRIEDPHASFANNDLLRCLTWIFAACPAAAQQAVFVAFNAVLGNQYHKLMEPAGSKKAVVHGLGRIVTNPNLIRAVLPKLVASLPDTALLAPLASLLSRPAATPAILADLDIEVIAQRLQPVFRAQNAKRAFDINYKYVMMALAGLLRVRAHHPWALLADHSESARILADELRRAAELLERPSAGNRGFAERKELTLALIEYLETNEGRPDLLIAMDLN